MTGSAPPRPRRDHFDPALADRWLAPAPDDPPEPLGRFRPGIPWWARVALVWLVGRAFTWALTVLTLSRQSRVVLPGAVDYFTYASIWDGAFYQLIHDQGYPDVLPRDGAGMVQGSQWAFLPVYPLLVRLVTGTTHASWPVAATTTSLLASLGFLLVTYQLFRTVKDEGTSLAAVAVVSLAGAAPVLQFAYAESLALFGVAAVLLLLARGRYLLAAPLVVLTGLTRPMSVPLAITCLLTIALVVAAHRREGLGLPSSTRWSLGVLGVLSVAGVAVWPAIAAFRTGEPTAYFMTEAAWHGGHSQLSMSILAVQMVSHFGVIPGAVVTAAVVIGLGWSLLSLPSRRLGAVMWSWLAAWLVYLAVLTGIDSESPRLLLGAFPAALVVAAWARKPAHRVALMLAAVASQVAFMTLLWHLGGGNTDYHP